MSSLPASHGCCGVSGLTVRASKFPTTAFLHSAMLDLPDELLIDIFLSLNLETIFNIRRVRLQRQSPPKILTSCSFP